MKAEINCPILTSEKFSKEVLGDIVTSLEKLENTKATIFNRLNSAFAERVNKLCNIKARINRANQIIASFSNINDAITLKSKYHYPTQKHSFYTPTIIDQNATSLNKEPVLKLNKVVLNEKNNLGSKSLAAKDKIVTYDKYLSFATQFNDIVNQLVNIEKQESSVRQSLEDFEPILNNVTSAFTFGTNMKIEYAKKLQYNPLQDINRGTSIVSQEKAFNEEERKKRKKIIQQAPKSIRDKEKLRKHKKHQTRIRKPTGSKITYNLPTNIQLGGVTTLEGADDDDDGLQEKDDEEEEEDDDFIDDNETLPSIEEQDEDNNPIDIIRYNNRSKIQASKNIQNTPNTNYQRPVNTSVNTSNNNVNNNNNNIPNQVQISNTVPQPPPAPPKPIVTQPQPKAPSPPPSVPTSSNIQVIVGNASGIPPPPPPPPPPKIVPTIPTKPSGSAAVKKNDGPEISLEEELAKAKSGLKKTVDVEVKEKPKELSFAEQLLLSKNKLKKAVIAPKPEVKKQNGLDLLSEQIKLRFRNLRMHEEENQNDNSDDDSF